MEITSSFLAFDQNKAEKVLNFSSKSVWCFLIYVLNFAAHEFQTFLLYSLPKVLKEKRPSVYTAGCFQTTICQ